MPAPRRLPTLGTARCHQAAAGLGGPARRAAGVLAGQPPGPFSGRAEAPDAFLLYKPHPDVVSGLRASGAADAALSTRVDAVVMQADLPQLLSAVDQVHVMTSLAGFEALLRGVPVVCHGLPFYAGWGLTEDRCAAPRRTRRLTLDELVAGALLRYPRYFSRDKRRTVAPEAALELLLAWRGEERRRGPAWWRPWWRAALRVLVGVR